MHVLPAQHGSPSLPHDSQNPPDVQTWVTPIEPQADPCPTHRLVVDDVSQQPPPLHWLPRQHASPGEPHGWHVVPLHTDEPPEHCSPS